MLEVWRLGRRPASLKLGVYDQHIKSLLAINTHLLEFTRVDQILELLSFLKDNGQKSVEDVLVELRTRNPPWLSRTLPAEAALAGIDLELRLWLFTSPDLSDVTLK